MARVGKETVRDERVAPVARAIAPPFVGCELIAGIRVMAQSPAAPKNYYGECLTRITVYSNLPLFPLIVSSGLGPAALFLKRRDVRMAASGSRNRRLALVLIAHPWR